MDSGAQFPRAGLAAQLILDCSVEPSTQVEIMSTGTREAEREHSLEGVRQAVDRLAGRLLFKKIDSTMRGMVGPEVRMILQATRMEHALICPAIIEEGRTVRGGRLFVNGVALDQSDFRHDPAYPAWTSEIAELVGGDVARLSLATVREGPQAVVTALREIAQPLVVADATATSDLDCLGEAALASGSLPVGAFGFAEAWIRALHPSGSDGSTLAVTISGKLLILIGSLHPVTQEQLRFLLSGRAVATLEVGGGRGLEVESLAARGRAILRREDTLILHLPAYRMKSREESVACLEAMAQLARRMCEEQQVGGLWVSGGETAACLCRALGTRAIDVRGELQPGVPVGILRDGAASGAFLITKAGGFGRRSLLLDTLTSIRADR